MNELLLTQPDCTFVHLFSVSRESENVLFIRDYRINQGCTTTARKTHIFHIAVQTHSTWTEMDKRIMNGKRGRWMLFKESRDDVVFLNTQGC